MRHRLALTPVLFLVLAVICACSSAADGVPAEDVRLAIQRGIEEQGNAVALVDPRSDEPVQLVFDYVHEGVNPTPGGRYVACVDFRSPDGTVYDVDYYVAREGPEFRVEDFVIHEIAGNAVIDEEIRQRLESLE